MRLDSGGFQPGPVQGQAASHNGRAAPELGPYHERVDRLLTERSPPLESFHVPFDDQAATLANDNAAASVPFYSGHVSPALSSPSSDASVPFASTSPGGPFVDTSAISALSLDSSGAFAGDDKQQSEQLQPQHHVDDKMASMMHHKQQQDKLAKAFMMDFMNMPLDSISSSLTSAHHSPSSSFDQITAFITSTPDPASALAAASLGRIPSTGIASFDRTLESPLGLETSPFSEFATTPLFDDFAIGELPPPLDYPLFAPVTIAASVSSSGLVAPTSTPIMPSYFASPAPSLSASPSLAPAPTSLAQPPSSKPVPNGFRKTQLLDISAPVQPRTALLPSKTTKKRKTTAAEREIVKRIASGEIAPTFESLATPDALPEDVVAAVEKKRLQNTISARKSRQRKMNRLQELEDENEGLKEENKRLMQRLALLEGSSNSVGGSVSF